MFARRCPSMIYASTGVIRGEPSFVRVPTRTNWNFSINSRPRAAISGAACSSSAHVSGSDFPATRARSADADQLLVDELVGPVAAELSSEAGALRAAERQLGTVCADDVHVDHAGVDPVGDALRLVPVVRHHV